MPLPVGHQLADRPRGHPRALGQRGRAGPVPVEVGQQARVGHGEAIVPGRARLPPGAVVDECLIVSGAGVRFYREDGEEAHPTWSR